MRRFWSLICVMEVAALETISANASSKSHLERDSSFVSQRAVVFVLCNSVAFTRKIVCILNLLTTKRKRTNIQLTMRTYLVRLISWTNVRRQLKLQKLKPQSNSDQKLTVVVCVENNTQFFASSACIKPDARFSQSKNKNRNAMPIEFLRDFMTYWWTMNSFFL